MRLSSPWRRHESVSVSMDQLPVLAFSAEHFGYTEIHRRQVGAAAHSDLGVLNARPISDAVTGDCFEDVQLAIPIRTKKRGVTLIP